MGFKNSFSVIPVADKIMCNIILYNLAKNVSILWRKKSVWQSVFADLLACRLEIGSVT